MARLAPDLPGDPASGILAVDADGDLDDRFEDFANQEPCPALDPDHGTCDLYQSRPHPCRVFGPPVATEEGYGVCELCFQTATPAEVAAAAMTPESPEMVTALDRIAMDAGVCEGQTILAFALSAPERI